MLGSFSYADRALRRLNDLHAILIFSGIMYAALTRTVVALTDAQDGTKYGCGDFCIRTIANAD